MLSSYRIIKSGSICSENQNPSVIQTKIAVNSKGLLLTAGKNTDKPLDKKTELTDEEIRRDLILKMEEKKMSILQAAKKQADIIIENAEKKGYEDGYKAGYEKALFEAKEEASGIKQKALNLFVEANKNVEEYYEQNKENILNLSARIAETIIKRKIDLSDKDILSFIGPVLEGNDIYGNVVISCHPEKAEQLKTKMGELQKISSNTKYTILSDENLEEYGCTIENQFQYIDLQIRKQIDAVLEEINNME